jgi:hypothetical protein
MKRRAKPLSLRTNCSEDTLISSSVDLVCTRTSNGREPAKARDINFEDWDYRSVGGAPTQIPCRFAQPVLPSAVRT